LVTLSSCESGINKYYSGEELIGFTRAFMYAGTKSIIISLWLIYDPSTYEFMTSFYNNLKKGMSKIVALQKAQIKLLEFKKYSHPYYWAPFVLYGNYE
jgi:CHAT domain-containing protein